MWKSSSAKALPEGAPPEGFVGVRPSPAVAFVAAVIGAGVAVACCIALLAWYRLPPVATMDHMLQDAFIRLDGINVRASAPLQHVALVDVDDDSLQSIGQWPWPRYRVARLLNTIAGTTGNATASPPAAVAVDILFSEPDRASLTTIQDAFQREFGLGVTFEGVPPGMEDNDAYLGRVFAKTKAVAAYFMYFDMWNTTEECVPPPLQVTGAVEAITPPRAHGILCNTAGVQQGVRRGGTINALLDADGDLRALPMLSEYQGRWHPNLTLAALMQAQGVDTIRIETDVFGPVIVAGKARLPVDEMGRAIIGFLGPRGSVPSVSAVQVLAEEADLATLAGRIVFVGSSAAGLQDLYQTPMGPEFPGAEIHGVLAENAMTGTGVRVPVWRQGYAVALTILTGLAVSLLFVLLEPGRAAAGAIAVGLVAPALGTWLFFSQGVLLPMAGPMLTAFVLFAMLSLLFYARERRRAIQRLELFSRARQTILEAMAAVAETRDPETGGHIKRTQHYIRVLAERLARKGGHPMLTSEYIEMLFHCAPLHDVGKVGIPDKILMKPGRLTFEEYEIMKQHAAFGKTIMDNASQGQQGEAFFLLAGELAFTHHERWDGQGYPLGLAGEAIPLSGRLMALVDVYDALVNVRYYKEAFTHAKAKAIILEGRGTHFDPQVIDVFIEMEQEFVSIAAQLKDREGEDPQ